MDILIFLLCLLFVWLFVFEMWCVLIMFGLVVTALVLTLDIMRMSLEV